MQLVRFTGRRKPDVQMSPLIDVVFLLLIFYAVTTQFVSDERLKLKLPEAKTAESEGVGKQEAPPEVVVSADGTIFIDDEVVPEEELEARMKTLVENAPDGAVILKGDRDADYGIVVMVLDTARAAGANMIQMSADRPQE
jgi:biopolymer transport protein ExbD